jgi:Ig-like domain from next to BRCA1 gene
MHILIKRIGGLCILASFLFISACGNAATPSPTVDPALIYTSAAQTVEAELTQTDVAGGPSTATITPFPLITDTPGVPTAILGNGAVLPTLPGPQTTDEATTGTPAAVVPTLVQSAAPTQATGHTAEAQWVSNDPPDGALVVTGAKFDIIWTLKNISKNTWTKQYSIRYFSGTNIVEKKQYFLKAAVAPGDNGSITVDAIAPSKPGTYLTWWKLQNDQGVNVGDMNITIKVVNPDTTPEADTATPKATKTSSP